jgi:transketolase
LKELLNSKRGLEVLEVKGHERDLQIQLLTVENWGLVENNKVLTDQVTSLKESLLEAKNEWKGLKDSRRIRKYFVVEIREVVNSKTPKDEGKTCEQAYTHGVKARDEEKKDFTKISKTWAHVISNSANMQKETHSQGDDIQDKENKEIKSRETYIIIKGVREYGKNECTLDLASEFLKEKWLWQNRIC